VTQKGDPASISTVEPIHPYGGDLIDPSTGFPDKIRAKPYIKVVCDILGEIVENLKSAEKRNAVEDLQDSLMVIMHGQVKTPPKPTTQETQGLPAAHDLMDKVTGFPDREKIKPHLQLIVSVLQILRCKIVDKEAKDGVYDLQKALMALFNGSD
jgi:hypothetical protein